ncbi:MAG: MGMT family protein [Stagnimonas sp.]|nr:MGMT family protein [Stagnimonas sp.]
MKLTRGPRPPKTTADAFMKARRDILETIQRIPRGKVASYSGVAFAAGWPGRARLVARVLSDVPPEYEGLPWQRVINAQGKIAIPKSSPGHLKQQRLLKAEGVVILNGKISFAAHGWKPGDASPLLD